MEDTRYYSNRARLQSLAFAVVIDLAIQVFKVVCLECKTDIISVYEFSAVGVAGRSFVRGCIAVEENLCEYLFLVAGHSSAPSMSCWNLPCVHRTVIVVAVARWCQQPIVAEVKIF